MRQRILFAGVVLLLVAAGVATFLSRSRTILVAQSAPQRSASANDTESPTVAADSFSASSTTSHHQVLDVPSFEQALSQAQLGNPQQACRIARQLARCRTGQIVGSIAQSRLDQYAQDERLDLAEEIASLELTADELTRHCQSFRPEHFAQEWRFLALSAEAGDAQSLFESVVAPPIDLEHPLGSVEALQYYRQHALEFVNRLIAMRSIEGLSLAFRAASGAPFVGRDALRNRSAEDLVAFGTALQHATGLSRSQQPLFDAAWEELTSTQRADAQARGLELATGAKRLVSGDDEHSSVTSECSTRAH